jgi:hypothetical protein
MLVGLQVPITFPQNGTPEFGASIEAAGQADDTEDLGHIVPFAAAAS